MLEYLFIAFSVICGVQVFFYAAFALFFPKYTSRAVSCYAEPVSVVICAKNEAENLRKHLPHFENQNYDTFELVLINDNSSDDTLEVMEHFKASSQIPVKIVNVTPSEHFWGNKKFALTLGIKAASHEQLLFTDADCIPDSSYWIATMVSEISSKKDIVLGYGAYMKINKSFLNKLIRFETLVTAIFYFSLAKIGLPYMGVGRNLSYSKKTFYKAGGFMNHMHIKSGDDDLFINQVANRNNTICQVSPESFTRSIPKLTLREWLLQKRRHISTATSYKALHKVLLGLFHLSQILFFTLGIVLLLSGFQWEFALGLIALRFFSFYLVISLSGIRLKETDLLLFAPLFELFLLLSQIYIFIQNLISKPKHW